MSDNSSDLEIRLKREVKSCNEAAKVNTGLTVANIYKILTELPIPVKICLQSFISDYPITKPLKEKYPFSDAYD